MADARALFELLRPGNMALAFAAVVVGAVTVAPWESLDRLPVLTAALGAAAATAAGNSYNDHRDAQLDRHAHPQRPIPSGRLDAGLAFQAAVVLGSAALALAAVVHPTVLALAALNLALLVAYEQRWKASGLAGNLLVSWLVATLFPFGALAQARPETWLEAWPLLGSLLLGGLAFAANLSRELVKDVEDLEADRGARNTLPMRLGVPRTRVLAAAALLAGVAASVLPWLWLRWPTRGLPFVLVADAVFLLALLRLRRPSDSSWLLKVGMVLAVLAFAVARA